MDSHADRRIIEAASLDGASRWKQFINITLPMLSPTTFFVLVFTFDIVSAAPPLIQAPNGSLLLTERACPYLQRASGVLIPVPRTRVLRLGVVSEELREFIYFGNLRHRILCVAPKHFTDPHGHVAKRCAAIARKCPNNGTMSARRSRSGGMRRRTTLRRK